MRFYVQLSQITHKRLKQHFGEIWHC